MTNTTPVYEEDLLSTGSTLLNLACTGSPFGGFLKGHYYFIVGDSASGKTFLSMTCFAEALLHPDFKNHRLIYDNIEDGMLMDLSELFNDQVEERIEPPLVKQGEPVFSSTVEEFYYHLDDAVQTGKPFIYILDSMDALFDEGAEKKFQEHKKAHQEGKKAEAGSYRVGKARMNSEYLRKAMKGLRETGSILIILSQTRENIGASFGGKTRSGGHSLRFYATLEIWSSISEAIKKTVKGKPRKVGVRTKLDVKKNRVTGMSSSVEIDIYPTFGIDDLGSCVDYLVEENHWTMAKQTIKAEDLGLEGTREKLIRLIEKKGLEDKVRELCGDVWEGIVSASRLRRKNRYTQQEAQDD